MPGFVMPSALTECRPWPDNRPMVHLSFAQSLDGRIATFSGDSRGLSSVASLELTHQIREESDAILIGINTVLADDPLLNCRRTEGCANQPLRIILDTQLRLPLDCRITRSADEFPTIVFCSEQAAHDHALHSRLLQKSGVKIEPVAQDNNGLSLSAILTDLYKQSATVLFVEGGSTILSAFIRQNLVDLLTLFISPRFIGRGIEAIQDLQTTLIEQSQLWSSVWYREIDGDMVWRLRPPELQHPIVQAILAASHIRHQPGLIDP